MSFSREQGSLQNSQGTFGFSGSPAASEAEAARAASSAAIWAAQLVELLLLEVVPEEVDGRGALIFRLRPLK